MSLLIKNALTVLPDGDAHEAGRHDIYIDGSDIVGIDAAPEGFAADETIDATRLLAIPGLINGHTHSYMSLLRNVADDLSFFDWLRNRVEPIEDEYVHEDAYWCSLLSQSEMIRSGTTCFNDMQMFIHQTTRAVEESGMRAVICRGLVGDSYDRDDFRIAEALEERAAFSDCSRLSFTLGPHAPYSCGPEYLRLVVDIAHEQNMRIHTHISESKAEVDNFLDEHGCTPVEYMRDAGVFSVPTLAAHCVHTTASDHEILAENGVCVVTNPVSNMKLGNGFAPVPELIAAGVRVFVGSDSVASNNAQNMFREMAALALVHKGVHGDPECLTAEEVLTMATRNAAEALGLATGAIEVGRKADIALLDLDSPALTPLNNPVAGLIYAANGSEVDTVIIDGQVVMRGRELLTIDEERVRHEIERIGRRIGLVKD